MAETTGIHPQIKENPDPTLAKHQTYRLQAHTRLVPITSVHSFRLCNKKVSDVNQLKGVIPNTAEGTRELEGIEQQQEKDGPAH